MKIYQYAYYLVILDFIFCNENIEKAKQAKSELEMKSKAMDCTVCILIIKVLLEEIKYKRESEILENVDKACEHEYYDKYPHFYPTVLRNACDNFLSKYSFDVEDTIKECKNQDDGFFKLCFKKSNACSKIFKTLQEAKHSVIFDKKDEV